MALIINDSVSIGAGARNADVLANFRNALIDVTARRGAAIAISLTASATGLYVEAFVGQRNVIERSLVSAQNRVPLVPDDQFVNRVPGLPNERIRLSADNPTGGAITLFFKVEIEEL